MSAVESGLVEIVREFLAAHGLLHSVSERYRAGALAFDEVGELVGDDERSVLFRLKERCHVLFRGEGGEGAIATTVVLALAEGVGALAWAAPYAAAMGLVAAECVVLSWMQYALYFVRALRKPGTA